MAEDVKAVAWLVTNGRTFVDRAFVGIEAAEHARDTRNDGAEVQPLYPQQAIDALRAEVSSLRAARIAYANEFPPDADGVPDVGNIHANLRALKERALRAVREAPVADAVSTEGYPVALDGRSYADDDKLRAMIGQRVALVPVPHDSEVVK